MLYVVLLQGPGTETSWHLRCIAMWIALLILMAGDCESHDVHGPDPADPADVFGWTGGGIDRLRFFKERLGFEPRHVLDIGAHVGNWTIDALQLFPSAQFLMIEANPKHQAELKAVGQPFVIAMLAAKGNESVPFHSTRYPLTTGASMFRERSDLYIDPRFAETLLLRTQALDDVIAAHFVDQLQDGCCDLLKADVQGAEIAVLLGGLRTLSQAKLVLLEAPVLPYNEGAPRFSELIAFMASQGFEVVDVADATYAEGVSRVLHLDLLFAPRFSRLLRLPLPGGILPSRKNKKWTQFRFWHSVGEERYLQIHFLVSVQSFGIVSDVSAQLPLSTSFAHYTTCRCFRCARSREERLLGIRKVPVPDGPVPSQVPTGDSRWHSWPRSLLRPSGGFTETPRCSALRRMQHDATCKPLGHWVWIHLVSCWETSIFGYLALKYSEIITPDSICIICPQSIWYSSLSSPNKIALLLCVGTRRGLQVYHEQMVERPIHRRTIKDTVGDFGMLQNATVIKIALYYRN